MSNTTDNKNEVIGISFSAINRYIEKNIVEPTETKTNGKEWISWGDGNIYPNYLLDHYKNVPTLKSIIDGTTDYITGDDVTLNVDLGFGANIVNRKGQTIREVVHSLAWNAMLFGGIALQEIKRADFSVAEIHSLDLHNIRTSKEREVFFYSEGWTSARIKDFDIYPKWMPNSQNPTSILYVPRFAIDTYPVPMYSASVKACEIEKGIDTFHLNSLENGFSGSYLVNMNNGVPSDRIKEQIEQTFCEKFTGKSNAGRVVFSWNNSKDTQATLQKMEVTDFGEKYKSLAERARQEIFTAFRATPNLFGLMTETTGFNEQEFAESFKLYNRTCVKPVQKMILEALDKIFGVKNSVTITPFSLD